MIALTVIIIVLVLALTAMAYMLGFRLGGSSSQAEIAQVRAQSLEASRQMHELTKAAFVAMAEEAERQRRMGW